MRPSMSCSPSGSFEASSNAFWSSFVIRTNISKSGLQITLLKTHDF
jgi:hypothetical protein